LKIIVFTLSLKIIKTGESLIFAKDFFGHPARKNRQKLNATVYFASQAPIRIWTPPVLQANLLLVLGYDCTRIFGFSVERNCSSHNGLFARLLLIVLACFKAL
jgi:hypothetical protein